MEQNQALKNERLKQGWSQSRVAEKIGTDARSVGRWERGEITPSPYFREKLCQLYKKDARDLGFLVGESGRPQEPGPIYDPSLPPLPNEGRALVGRQALLEHLAEQLCVDRCLVLSGLPGVGKTAMAVALLKHPRIQSRFCDGVLWAGLGPQPNNVLGKLSNWGKLLELPVAEAAAENSLEARAFALRAGIGLRRIVLVVDDAWDVESALSLKVGGPHCAFVVTTRSPDVALGIVHRYTMIPELLDNDGLTLLEQLAPEAVAYDAQEARTLVQQVGGLPLALLLLGKYLHRQASGPRRLQNALDRLHSAAHRLQVSGPASPLERPPGLQVGVPLSLQSIIAVSDMQLDKTTRAAFYALSVFPAKPGSFSEQAALMVSQAVEKTLDTLYDVGLLENSGQDRYTLHQTIADYAAMQLTELLPGERFVAYCISFIEKHAQDYAALAQESHNLLAGLKSAFENRMEALLVRGVDLFTPFLLARGLYDLALLHLQRAYQIVIWPGAGHGMLVLIRVYLHMGMVLYRQRDYHQAAIQFHQGLKQARDHAYREQTCQFLLFLGMVAIQQEFFPQAEVYSREGLALARDLEHVRFLCDALMNLASIAGGRGNDGQMEGFLQEALALAGQRNSALIVSQILCTWGELKLRQRRLADAQTYFQQARQQLPAGALEPMARALYGLARVARELGEEESACEQGREALKASEAVHQGLAQEIRAWLACCWGT
jgi:transcriptional regulator with XRE-family HTH domain/tetratricopeptide (TPR) repeat protein